MITLLTVGDGIRSFSETFRDKYQSIFFVSVNTLTAYLAIHPNDPFILVLNEITDQGLVYTDVLSYLQEREWLQPTVVVMADECASSQTSDVVFSCFNPPLLDKVIQSVAHANFSFS